MIQFFGDHRPSPRVRRRRVPAQYGCASHSNPGGIPGSAAAVQVAQHSGYGRVLRVGSCVKPHAGSAEPDAAAQQDRPSEGRLQGRAQTAEEGARMVALLRGRPRARPDAHDLEPGARRPAAPVRRLFGRRPRHHGGGQPRGDGSGREIHRPEHPSPVRAGAQPVHHEGSRLQLPLLLHAEVLVRVPGESARRLPRRVRHASTRCSRSSRSRRPASSRRSCS